MPDWAVTVVVGLASGLVGTILSTVLRISHERANDLRTRMLDAADDFVTAAVAASEALRSVNTSVEWARIMRFEPDDDDHDRLNKAGLAIKAANDRLPRLRLLYGRASDTARRADELKAAMQDWAHRQANVFSQLKRGEFDSDGEAPGEGQFDEELNAFSTAARTQIVGRFG